MPQTNEPKFTIWIINFEDELDGLIDIVGGKSFQSFSVLVNGYFAVPVLIKDSESSMRKEFLYKKIINQY